MKKASLFTAALGFCLIADNYVNAQSKTGEHATGQTPHQAVNDRVKPYYNDGNAKDYPKAAGTSGSIEPAAKASPASKPPVNSSLGQKATVPPRAVNDRRTKPAY